MRERYGEVVASHTGPSCAPVLASARAKRGPMGNLSACGHAQAGVQAGY
jgi:hypothetical protein